MATALGDTYYVDIEDEDTGVNDVYHYLTTVCDDHYHSRLVIQSRHDTLEAAREMTRYRMRELATEVGGCGFDVIPAEEIDP